MWSCELFFAEDPQKRQLLETVSKGFSAGNRRRHNNEADGILDSLGR